MSNASVLSNAQRQAELEARHRDLTRAVPPIGSDGDSLRSVKGFEGITDEMLQARATFNLNSQNKGVGLTETNGTGAASPTIDMQSMSLKELHGLADAALTEAARRQETENGNA